MRSNKCLSLLSVAIVMAAWTPFAFTADADLVLHYRFDRDEGDKVTDHSPHRNDGLNRFGQFLEQVRGRKGVMRFDGETAVVEATDDALALAGDFSYALWVRRHRSTEPAHCGIFGASHYTFSLSNHVNLTFDGYSANAAGDNVAMSWPVDRDMLGTDWSHLAVVVAYPRVRFYRNGRLIRDAWMPFSFESPRESGKKVSLGSTGRRFGAIDLDEVMIFRRALTPAEVQDLAAGKTPAEIPAAAHAEILMEPYWYEDRLTFRLSAYHGFDLRGQTGRARFELRTIDGPEQIREVPCAASRSTGRSRTIAAADFPLEQLAGMAFRVRVEVRGSDGTGLGDVEKQFLLQKPAWVHNRAGVPYARSIRRRSGQTRALLRAGGEVCRHRS